MSEQIPSWKVAAITATILAVGTIGLLHVTRIGPTIGKTSKGISKASSRFSRFIDPKHIKKVCKKYSNITRKPTYYTFHVDERFRLATCFHYKVKVS